MLASTAPAGNNRLETRTLGWTDIKNRADYEVEHQSAGLSTGGAEGSNFLGNLVSNTLAGMNGSGHADSTTRAAVEAETITVRDGANQQQDVSQLSRDTAHAANGLSPIFDKEKEQRRLEASQLIAEIGTQVGDIARTEGKIAATTAGKAELAKKGIKEPGANATAEEWATYDKALTETEGYKQAQQKWGTGSAVQQGIQAVTAAVQGLAGGVAGGDTSSAAAGAEAGRNVVENNSLGDIAENQAAGRTQAERYQKAQDEIVKATEEFKVKNCAGLSTEACGAKMDAHRDELLAGFANAGLDFVPVVGTMKSLVEAQTALDYLLSVASIIPGERVASGLLSGAKKALAKGDVTEASRLMNKASDEISSTVRSTPRQSEIDVGKDLGDGWREQVSFKDGKEVPYGTKDSVRPDWCQGNICSVEVKNYNVEKNQNGLISNVAKQAIDRQKNLPDGMCQEVVIDVRGQKMTSVQEDAIVKGIVQRSNGAIKPTDIQFER